MRIVEHLVIDSGVPYTILRPNLFMENFSAGFLAPSIREQHAIYLAAGDGKTSFISVEDIVAAVTAAVKQSLAGKEFDLTGSAALNQVKVALKWFFPATAVGLIFSTLLGLYMAFKFNRSRAIVWGMLFLGTAIPLALILMMV